MHARAHTFSISLSLCLTQGSQSKSLPRAGFYVLIVMCESYKASEVTFDPREETLRERTKF